MIHPVLVGSIGELWDYCGPAESCGDNRTQYLTNWNEYLDPATPGTCADYEGGMCEAFVPIGSRIFVPGNVDIADLDSRADRFILSTGSFSFLPRSCRCRDLFYLPSLADHSSSVMVLLITTLHVDGPFQPGRSLPDFCAIRTSAAAI
jgi:hypothetical protein